MKMTSENNIESNSNNENQDNNSSNEPYQKDIETNIDYEIWFKKEPTLKGKIIDLNYRIDNIDEQQKTLADHVLELARTINESNLCETDKICITIKEILKEKIKRGKISEKWIEECLPSEYKRKYEKKKSEVSSLSRKKKQTPLLVTDNSSKSSTVTQDDNAYTDPSEQKDQFYYHNDIKEEPTDIEFSNTDLIGENKELKETMEKNTPFQNANNLIKEIQFPKEKSKELIAALDKCVASVFIRFNAKGIVELIESDTIRDQISDEDTNNDNYTY